MNNNNYKKRTWKPKTFNIGRVIWNADYTYTVETIKKFETEKEALNFMKEKGFE